MVDIVRETYAANKQVCFDGDNYDEAWHAEAEKRGLANLRTTPDALPWLVEKQTIATFERYKVLSERELESRFEVMVEQYTTRVNIEAETAASIARTMLLPAAIRHLADLKAAGHDDARGRDRGARGRVLRRRSSPSRRPTRTTRPRRASSWPSTCATRS